MAGASPVTMFSTPGGRPARTASSPSAKAVSGVSGAGLITQAQPAAKAGAHLRVIIAAGKFHGVIAAITPIGWRRVRMRASGQGEGMVSP